LWPEVEAQKKKIPKGKTPIFLSRRFVENDLQSDLIVQELRRVLIDRDFHPVEGTPEPGSRAPASYEVLSKMWISEAAILLVTATPDQSDFSHNLAHEAGFFQGQGKELLPLVQRGAGEQLQRAPNFSGLQLQMFDPDRAALRDDKGSLGAVVGRWLEKL
jgi:hypothetical protein